MTESSGQTGLQAGLAERLGGKYVALGHIHLAYVAWATPKKIHDRFSGVGDVIRGPMDDATGLDAYLTV